VLAIKTGKDTTPKELNNRNKRIKNKNLKLE
jgi:hypothetical protein